MTGTTINNGLTLLSGDTIQLGGELIKNTYIWAKDTQSIYFGLSGETYIASANTTIQLSKPLISFNVNVTGGTNSNISGGLGVDGAGIYSAMNNSTTGNSSYSNFIVGIGALNYQTAIDNNSSSAYINIAPDFTTLYLYNNDNNSSLALSTNTFNVTVADNNSSLSSIISVDVPGQISLVTYSGNTDPGFTLRVGSYSNKPSMFFGTLNRASINGYSSFGMGTNIQTSNKADYSFAGGLGHPSKYILTNGRTAFNWSENTSGQTFTHGAQGANSAILGGINHNIPTTAVRSVVIGGNGIKVNTIASDTVHMPKLKLGQGINGALPTLFTGSNLLGITTAGDVGNCRVNNGVSFANGVLKLGGTITGTTTIGLGTNSLTFTATSGSVKYGSDLSANYTDRSLIDKGYMKSVITGNTTMPVKFPSYTVATLPSASQFQYCQIIVTNEIGGSVPAFSDGINWRRMTDRNIIS